MIPRLTFRSEETPTKRIKNRSGERKQNWLANLLSQSEYFVRGMVTIIGFLFDRPNCIVVLILSYKCSMFF